MGEHRAPTGNPAPGDGRLLVSTGQKWQLLLYFAIGLGKDFLFRFKAYSHARSKFCSSAQGPVLAQSVRPNRVEEGIAGKMLRPVEEAFQCLTAEIYQDGGHEGL